MKARKFMILDKVINFTMLQSISAKQLSKRKLTAADYKIIFLFNLKNEL